MSVKGRYLHVVVASDTVNLHIITAYYPNTDEWETDFKTNVNNLTQATTTYSVSFNWHGIPCAFLYL